MKNILSFLLVATIMGLVGCTNKKAGNTANMPTLSEETEADSTVYGKCGEGSAMHTLELITDKGDTLVYAINDDDSCSVVKGGLFAGDRLAVTGYKQEEGLVATQVINITSLLGKWVSLDKTFDLQEGGVVVSNVKEPKPYTEWKIQNGHLVLSSDTFDIYNLGPDSLYLENAKGIYGYKRSVENNK